MTGKTFFKILQKTLEGDVASPFIMSTDSKNGKSQTVTTER
jgi:hypothetical protein